MYTTYVSLQRCRPGAQAHAAFQQMVRGFVEQEIMPHVADWEEQEDFPADLVPKAYAAGVYAAGLPREYGGTGTEMDAYHRFIFNAPRHVAGLLDGRP